jgi:type VI secretion system protein ImpG
MDERLLEYYNVELAHLRESAGEFAREYPKIAGRLALDKDAAEICPDPYVERLLEGFAWLAARVHLKLDAEFPRFTQSLLETVYPHYLAPIPSMAIVRFDPEASESALVKGVTVPRGTTMRSNLGKGNLTACTFQTAHPVRLLPLRIVEAQYHTRDVGKLNLPREVACKAALRIRIESSQPVPIGEIAADPLSFFLRGADELPGMIYEQIFAHRAGLVLQSPTERGRTLGVLPSDCIHRVGFREDESLLPPSPRSFEGYRLLREYFTFPQRFLFVGLSGFGGTMVACKGNQLDLIILLDEADSRLENRVSANCLELYCTPAINLFRKQLDPVPLSDRFSEFHVVPDTTRPLDYEIFEIQAVTGYGAHAGEERDFKPFYLSKDVRRSDAAYFTTNRVSRVLSAREKQFGKTSAYAGTEVYISLVDSNSAPYSSDLKHIGIRALCTNRHLPIQMMVGIGQTDFVMDTNAPVTSIRCLTGPTLPKPSQAEGRFAWRLISHLSLNYLSLVDSHGGDGSAGLREILRLYAPVNDRQVTRQIEGLLKVHAQSILRRVNVPGPITFARGLQLMITFDEDAYEGLGVFVLGAVLEQFFAKYVSLNSFTETVITTQQRGEIIKWPAQMGRRHIL